MNTFKYVAIGPGGKQVTGQVLAKSVAAAEGQLLAKQLIPTELAEVSAQATSQRPFASERKKARVSDGIELLRSLSVMLAAGVQMIEALEAIAENASSPAIQAIAEDLKANVLKGQPLGKAMSAHPTAFSQLVCDMVAVGDEAGRMTETIDGAVSYMDRSLTVRKNVVGALIYPGILMGASLLSFLVLIVVILPTFKQAFDSLQVKLPLFTTLLLNFGIFLRTQPHFVIAGLLAMFFGTRAFLRTARGRLLLQKTLDRVPIVGDILSGIALNRSLRTLATLLSTRVPIVDALEYARRVSNHFRFEKAIEDVKSHVKNGQALAEAMRNTQQFPKMVVQMVAVGERSGRVDQLVTTLVEHREVDIDRKIKSAVSILEPLVIIGMGIMVGMITISILMPLFSINNSIR